MTAAPTSPRFGLLRREKIMDELRRSGSVRVADLADDYDVAELTIRRDLSLLADRGLLTRVHGGATLRSSLDTTVPRPPHGTTIPMYRIGMVVPSLSYYWPQVIIGARDAATTAGVQLVLRGATYSVEDQRRQIVSLVRGESLHGLVAAPETTGPDAHALLTWLESLSIPVVLAERRLPGTLVRTGLEWATTDHAFGGSLAANHLGSLGHSTVGILTSTGSPTSGPLRRGWLDAVEDLGLVNGVDADLSLESMDGVAREQLIDSVLDHCTGTGTTALLIHSDRQAVLVQQHARDRGWDIPGRLAIVAYDDEVAESAEPRITALRPPKQHVGRTAVELMIARLRNDDSRPTHRTDLLPALHERESTAIRRATG